jgi:hypothetical protein
VNISGWVWAENFRPFVCFLASETGYHLSDEEFAAAVAALEGSSAESGDWREFVLRGTPEIGMALAYEVGFDNVQIQFNCDERVGRHAEAAMMLMQRYLLTERPAEPAVAPDPAA